MRNTSSQKKLKKLAADAAAANKLRRDGALSLMKGFETVEGWVEQRSVTAEYYYEVHNKVGEALSVLLAEPGAPLPPVLSVLVDSDLDNRYPELDVASATFPQVTLAINYVMAQCVARALLRQPPSERHRSVGDASFKMLWSRFGPQLRESRIQWQAKEMLLALVFGDYPRAVAQFENDLRFDIFAHEDSHRTLAKLGYLIAKCAIGTADSDDRLAAKALVTLSQFNYYQWIVRPEPFVTSDPVTMVLVAQLYMRLCDQANVDREPFFASLAPSTVISAMADLLPGDDSSAPPSQA